MRPTSNPDSAVNQLGKRGVLGDMLGGGVWLGLVENLRKPSDEVLVLAYHRVIDIDDESRWPGDPELVSCGVAAFDRQMAWLRQYYQPVPLSSLIEALDGGPPLPRRSVIVTFDDGHLDNYSHAFPVLRKHGIAATIFLSTGLIGGDGAFWFERLAWWLNHASTGTYQLASCDCTFMLGDNNSRRTAAAQVVRALKRLPNGIREAAIDEMAERFDAEVPASLRQRRTTLNWDEVTEMASAGIEFGSHTVSHPILSSLTPEALQCELADSRRDIFARSGRPVDAIAYPVGKVADFNDAVLQATRAAGYRLGLSYESGTNRLGRLDRYALRRLAVERYVSHRYFAAMLQWPAFFS